MNQPDIQQQLSHIENSIAHSKEIIRRRDLLRRLQDNPDFKELIHEIWFKEEAARVVALKCDETYLDSHPAGREAAKEMLENIALAVGGLRQFFMTIYQMANTAESDLAADQETQAELLETQQELADDHGQGVQ